MPTQIFICGRVMLPQAVTNLAFTQLLPLVPELEKVQEEVFCPEEMAKDGPHVQTMESTGERLLMVKVAPEEQTIEGPEIGPPAAARTAL